MSEHNWECGAVYDDSWDAYGKDAGRERRRRAARKDRDISRCSRVRDEWYISRSDLWGLIIGFAVLLLICGGFGLIAAHVG